MSEKNLKDCIDLLKEEIIKANIPEVKITEDKLIYSLKKQTQYDISSYNQQILGELGRAYAIIHLIKGFKATAKDILREEKSPVGSPSKRVDIIMRIKDVYQKRKCIALVECKTSIHPITDREFTDYFKRQLYNIAHSYAQNPKEPYPFVLMAYQVSFENNEVNLDCKWFFYAEIVKMVETGQILLDDIISRNSPFAYSTIPQDLCFSKEAKILKLNDLIEISNPNELKKLLKEKIHQKLRPYGVIEDNAFYFILNLLLAKTYDEINASEKNGELSFQVKPEDYLNPNDFYNRIENLYQSGLKKLLKVAPKIAEEERIVNSPYRTQILLEIVPYLQRIKLRSARFLGEDTMGDIFLDFMHSIFRQSRGLFFTHPNICRFVCKAVNVEIIREYLKENKSKYILDPSCGSGTFLIEALRLIFKDYPMDVIKDKAPDILYGIDSEKVAVELCKVNMVIHGDGSASVYVRDALGPLSALPLKIIENHNIKEFDRGCTYEVLQEDKGVDFIITNPPFSLAISHDKYSHFQMKNFVPYENTTTMASECFFVERWFQLLNPDGRLGAVIPFSLLDSSEYLKARMLFLCYFKIIAIVGLPEHAFSPHAQQRTALVFAKRRKLEESNSLFERIDKPLQEFIEPIKDEKIIFYDAKNIGYVRAKKKKTIITRIIEENDLKDDIASIIADAFEDKIIKDERIAVFTLEELANRNFNLTPATYTIPSLANIFILQDEWEIAEIQKVEVPDLDLLLCETGDIVSGGAGILTPKDMSHTTASNKIRIQKKIESGKFGKLKEWDIVIAPVRVYQKKIAVITPSATNFLFSQDFIVLRKKDNPNLLDSFKLFFTLIQDENIKQLTNLSSTGKSGYPKIKDKNALLKTPFHKVDFDINELKNIAKTYEEIYKSIFVNPLWKTKKKMER